MSTITLELPDMIADEIRKNEMRLPEILATGLAAVNGSNTTEGTAAEVYAFFSRDPSPEEIMMLRPSKAYQRRIDSLLRMSKTRELTPGERLEWDEFERVEYLVTVAKAKAFAAVNQG